MSGELTVGNWKISESPDGSLVFSRGEHNVSITTSGGLVSQGKDFLRSKDPIRIKNVAVGGYLNQTMKGDGDHPSGFNGWTYWMTSPDSESNLEITKGYDS